MKTQPRPPDVDTIDLDDSKQMENWTRSLGVSKEDLVRAVAEVGSSMGAVYDYLARNRNRPAG